MATLREEVETAHAAVQRAQTIAYSQDTKAPLLVRLALNRAQTTLIRLLVHRLNEP